MVLVNRHENRGRGFIFPRCCLGWNNYIHSCLVSIDDNYRVGGGRSRQDQVILFARINSLKSKSNITSNIAI